jgi:hypothetical protein
MASKTISPTENSSSAENSTVGLLHNLIDYAGLFPPASLPMAKVVENYAAYLESEWSWILGRLVIPVARLDEFQKAFVNLPDAADNSDHENWHITALLGPDVDIDILLVSDHNARTALSSHKRKAIIDSVEVKAASVEQIESFAKVIPSSLVTYFEIPSDFAASLAAIARCSRRAKIRTGGETADRFPDSTTVVDFMRLCAATSVPFKATAGLHHPLRSVHKLTYQSDSPSGTMHGFLNVFLAAAFLRAGMSSELAIQLLEERSVDALCFADKEVSWRNHRLTIEDLSAVRNKFSISFGSCSFTEPVEDLRSLHLL